MMATTTWESLYQMTSHLWGMDAGSRRIRDSRIQAAGGYAEHRCADTARCSKANPKITDKTYIPGKMARAISLLSRI